MTLVFWGQSETTAAAAGAHGWVSGWGTFLLLVLGPTTTAPSKTTAAAVAVGARRIPAHESPAAVTDFCKAATSKGAAILVASSKGASYNF